MRERIGKEKGLALILLLSLAFSCASCNPPKVKVQERCAVSTEFNYGTEAEIAQFFSRIEDYKDDPELQKIFLKDVMDIFGKTKCHKYSLMRVKRVSNGYDRPLAYSNGTVGFKAKTWLKRITPWAKESKRFQENRCGEWKAEDGY